MSQQKKATEITLPPAPPPIAFTNATIDMVTDQDTENGTMNKFTFIKTTAINPHYLWRPLADYQDFVGKSDLDGSYTPGNLKKKRTGDTINEYSKLDDGYSAHN